MSAARLTDAQIATQLQELIGTPPPIGRGTYMPEMGRWAGRTAAVLQAHYGHVPVPVQTLPTLISVGNTRAMGVYGALVELETALAQIELRSQAVQGGDAAFGAGQPLDVYIRLSQELARAQNRLFIIDPYLDDTIITDYLLGLTGKPTIQLLTSRSSSGCFSRLKTASKLFIAQNAAVLEVKESTEIHDRILFVDALDQCLVMGASIKDAGRKKPTYLAPLDTEIAALKRTIYEEIWNRATQVAL